MYKAAKERAAPCMARVLRSARRKKDEYPSEEPVKWLGKEPTGCLLSQRLVTTNKAFKLWTVPLFVGRGRTYRSVVSKPKSHVTIPSTNRAPGADPHS